MIAALDSSYDAPSAEQADAARAAGVRVWCGYLGLPGGGRGLAHVWTRADFENARRCGGPPIGFCSGWDDPTRIRALAAEWNVRAGLDDEPGIRGDGFNRQAWCDAAGAGIYGAAGVHGVVAPFHIVADYPCAPPQGCDPGTTWRSGLARPTGALGRQWQGTHTEFGRSVDRSWLDDWFATGGPIVIDPNDPTIKTIESKVDQALNFLYFGGDGNWPGVPFVTSALKALQGDDQALADQLATLGTQVALTRPQLDAIAAAVGKLQASGSGTLTEAQQAELDAIKAAVDAANRHLGVGTA